MVGRSSMASTLLLALMPKCPYCLVGWAGALGLGGLSVHATMLPIAVLVVFCATQAVFWIAARRTGDRRALALAGIGIALVLADAVFYVGSPIRWLGIALVVAASILNSRILRASRSCSRTPPPRAARASAPS